MILLLPLICGLRKPIKKCSQLTIALFLNAVLLTNISEYFKVSIIIDSCSSVHLPSDIVCLLLIIALDHLCNLVCSSIFNLFKAHFILLITSYSDCVNIALHTPSRTAIL